MLRGVSWRKILYAVCFFWLCVIDQRVKTGTGHDGLIETFRDSLGIVMSALILSHYKWEDYRKRKLPCLIWVGVSVAGGTAAFLWGLRQETVYLNHLAVCIAGGILLGFVLIHTAGAVLTDRRIPRLRRGFVLLWAGMLLYMLFSRSHYSWPLSYLILFGAFYLTDYTQEEQADLLGGILDGLILAFFVLQGLCFVFRPYDCPDARYVGIHSNPNQNAIFYMEVLAAVLVRVIRAECSRAKLPVRLFYWTGAGVLLSFVFLTIGRTAWLVSFGMCAAFLLVLNRFLNYRRFIRNGLLLLLSFCLTFPLCFGAVRYLPPMFHHPVWFWGEWSEGKVHSWDPWNSEKFVDMDEFLDAALGRISGSVENFLEHSPFLMKAEASPESLPQRAEETVVDPREEAAVLTVEQGLDSLLVRSTIYGHYLRNLNFWGHPYEEQGFQLTRYYWIGHAHNIFLQFGTDFGIPVMIALFALSVWSAGIYVSRIRRKKSLPDLAFLLFLAIPMFFGMLEYSWGEGSLSMAMLFVAWRWGAVMQKGKEGEGAA